MLMAAVSLACGKPFNVKPRTSLPPAHYAAKASTNSVEVQAQAITDEDVVYTTFDANLISAGILPVRIMLTNSGAENLDLERARFEARAGGRSFKAAKADAAFKRLVSYYEISAYSKSGYKESKDDFTGHALDAKTPLAPGASRQGLLFFLMPGEMARGAGLTLSISRLGPKQSASPAPVELKLD